jgi:hypothetical protein
MEQIGTWGFIAGLVLSLIFGFASGAATGTMLTILIVLGLVVGLLNITQKEVHGFLVASIALMLVGTLTKVDSLPLIGLELQASLSNLVFFIGPAAMVVAIKEIFLLASEK